MIKIGPVYKALGRRTPSDDGRRKARYKFCVRKGPATQSPRASLCFRGCGATAKDWRRRQMMKASDLFVQCLEEEGVQYIFGVPGEENLDFLDSLSRSSKIKLILTRHEQGAGFMAATYGRHTGHTGVCVATLGPGATNFVTAAAYAQLGGMPILMITGQKPIKKSKQGRFQIGRAS